MTRERVKGVLLLSLMLASGILIGISYERRRSPSHDSAGTDTHHMLSRFERDLELDSTQRKAIAAILSHHQVAVDSTWHAVQPHVRAAMDSTLQEILAVLRPDQAAKYRQMVEARHPGTLR
jgi:hypothetical protein